MTRQCSSCGGFCKKSGCERENVPIITSSDVIAGLQMALSQAEAMIERQQHVMQPVPVQEPDRIAQLEAANTNLFEQGQKMHKRIQELEKDCKIGAQEMVKAYEEIDNLKAQVSWQKPVAWCQLGLDGKSIAYFDGKPMIMTGHVGNQHHPTPLFTAQPRKAVKLSDSEILTALDVEYVSSAQNRHLFLSDARIIEAAVWARLGVTE